MPASQATIILSTSLRSFLIVSDTEDFLPFRLSIWLVAAPKSPAVSALGDLFNITQPTKNETIADNAIPESTGIKLPGGVIAISAKILPGEGVATSPAPVTTKVNTP